MKFKKSRNRGARLTTKVSIPDDYHWKILGAMVEDLKAYLESSDVLLLKDIIRSRSFSRYLELDDSWGLHTVSQIPVESLDFQKLKARYAIGSLLKKYLPEPDKTLDIKAKEKFILAERDCKEYNDELGSMLFKGDTSYTRDLLAYMRGFLKQLLGDVVPVKAIVSEAKHGPGANLDTQDGDVTSFAKYTNFPYSCTLGSVGYACYMIQSDERWFQALIDFYLKANNLCSKDEIDMCAFWDYFIKTVPGNRITFVPKTAKISRSIAIEPALNLMLQLGVDRFIRRRLKRFGIDLDSQEPNQRLSRVGSKYGIYATIDLSSASDLISLKLCEMILPDEWYTFLCNLRSPIGVLDDGEEISYEKISSMGNGYTFVLESAIFAAIVFAVHKMKNQSLYFGINAAVFGDDIIVRGDMYDDVKHSLELCGFKLNVEKTYVVGPIRESCGADWFNGLPIRPVFLKMPPSDLQGLYVDYNTTKRFLEVSFGIQDSNVSRTILKWIPDQSRFFGPYSDYVFDSWLHSQQPGPYLPDGFHFFRLIKIAKKKKFTKAFKYGYWYFLKLCHNLRGRETPHFYELKRIRVEEGSRFTVNSKGFMVKRKPAVCLQWHIAYTATLPLIS